MPLKLYVIEQLLDVGRVSAGGEEQALSVRGGLLYTAVSFVN